jgi:uncharacterized protein YbaP (TraB family)
MRPAKETRKELPMMKTLMKSAAWLAAGLACGLALSSVAHGQTDYSAVEADPALWSISDEDSTVYLFGTVHVLPPELSWRTDAIDAAFEDSETIYFEVDALSPEAQAQMQALIPQLGLNAPGVTLSSMISDEAQGHVATIAQRLGAPADAFMSQLDPLQPWLASLQMAVLQMQSSGYQPGSGAEAALTAQAEEAGKSFGYFETVEQQLRFLSSSSMEVQLADFEVSVAQMVEDPGMLTELVQAWAVGDMEHIDRLINGELRDTSPELYDRIIVQRNHNWIPQILAALEGSEDGFVAVGAGHMPGEEGVIALLEAEGLTVTRR